MTDLTPLLNEVLKRHDAPSTTNASLSVQRIDEFLKEAYLINSHIASLNAYLRGIRQSYLSTATARRRLQPSRGDRSRSDQRTQLLTDHERDEIDAETKQLLRDLNAKIRNLADTEQIRQNTETMLLRKKYARLGLGSLGSWAAGGAGQTKSYDQELDEAKSNAIQMHRESVLWYLRQKLQEVGSLQAAMMETRIMREMEKNKSVLYKARSKPMPELAGFDAPLPFATFQNSIVSDEQQGMMLRKEQENADDDLTPQQLQMFEKENQEMLKHYEATLDQVRTAEKSLIEISELQTQLVANLETQSAHIDQLVQDSVNTADNVGGGNKQLKKATERKSVAKYVFYASCGLSFTLVLWDLLI